MMTEAEANETLMCPFAFSAMARLTLGGAKDLALALTRCQASACAAWRWHGPAERGFVIATDGAGYCDPGCSEPERPSDVPPSWEWMSGRKWEDPPGWAEPSAEMKARLRGYCGLAGKPEVP